MTKQSLLTTAAVLYLVLLGVFAEVLLDEDSTESTDKHEEYLKNLKLAYTVLAIACGVFFLSAVPYLFGFRREGVGAGSYASGCQSGIGNVVAGSLFALCQCFGAVTCFGNIFSVVLFVATGVSSLVILIIYHISKTTGRIF